MPKRSAGIVLYRHNHGVLEFLLVHPGGPHFKNKDAGAWSIPKGELSKDEDPFAAARREFQEELGFVPQGDFLQLAPVQQRGGKVVCAWAVAGDFNPAELKSNTFKIEWPPRSGRQQEFPEVDQAAFFPLSEARARINPAQIGLLEELSAKLSYGPCEHVTL